MSAEDYYAYKALRERRAGIAGERRQAFVDEFEAAKLRCVGLGLQLIKHTEIHYSLRRPGGWIVNLYPGNQRITFEAGRRRPPMFEVPKPWTFADVIDAVTPHLETTE